MSSFYLAEYVDAAGKPGRRSFFRGSVMEVRQDVERLGYMPVRIREQKRRWWNREVVSGAYKIRLLKSMSFHIGNGISPGKALALVIDSESNLALRMEMHPALEVLQRGGAFSEALQYMRLFNDTVVSMLRGGEAVGELRSAINACIRYMTGLAVTVKKMYAAAALIGWDVSVAVSAVFGIQFGALPWLEVNGMQNGRPEQMEEFKAAIANAYLLNGSLMWATIIASTVITTLLVAYFFGTKKQRQLADKTMGYIPLMKSIFTHGGVSDTYGIVATMVGGRVAMDKAIRTAMEATQVPSVLAYWTRVLRKLDNGLAPAAALQGHPLNRAENLAVGTDLNTEQLAAVMMEISREREDMAKSAKDLLIAVSWWILMFYTIAGFAISLYVLSVQGLGAEANLNNIGI